MEPMSIGRRNVRIVPHLGLSEQWEGTAAKFREDLPGNSSRQAQLDAAARAL